MEGLQFGSYGQSRSGEFGGELTYTRSGTLASRHAMVRSGATYETHETERPTRLSGFSSGASLGGKVSHYRDKQNIYKQGAPAYTLFYIQEGGVRLSTRTKQQPSAVTAILGVGDFFGEICLAGYPLRVSTAVALTASSIRTIQKKKMLQMLRKKNKGVKCPGGLSAVQRPEVQGSCFGVADFFCRATAGARAFAAGALG